MMVIISVVFGFAIYAWNSYGLTGNMLPMPFGVGVGVVMSPSMEPYLSEDDLIIVVEQDEYAVGDVVVYQQRAMLVVHKIYSIDGEEVVTYGTNNDGALDAPIHVSAIKGKVVRSYEKIGVVVNALKTPIGTVSILLIAGALLVYSYKAEKKESAEAESVEQIRNEIERLKEQLEKPDEDKQ